MENNLDKDNSGKEPSELAQKQFKDAMLEILSMMANVMGLGLSVTLNVDGGVVSGDIISTKQYFSEMNSIIDKATFHGGDDSASQSARKNITRILSSLAEVSDEPYKSFADNPVESELPITSNFIHLKNARLFVSNIPMNRDGMLWRGRIDRVSGFSVARFP